MTESWMKVEKVSSNYPGGKANFGYCSYEAVVSNKWRLEGDKKLFNAKF